MTISVNPKPIIRREMTTAQRKVDTAASLFDLDVAVGEKVFVNDRNCEYELIKTTRDQYLDVQSGGSDNSANYVSITGSSIGTDFSTLPVGTEIEAWVRIDDITTATVAPYNFRIGSRRFGFMVSSGAIRCRNSETYPAEVYLSQPVVYDEDGVEQDSEDLSEDVWYRVVVTVNTENNWSASSLVIGDYYRNSRIHYRDFRITTPTDTILFDFRTGAFTSSEYTPQKTIVANVALDPDTMDFAEDELVGNDLDLIEQESPYRLYRIKPIGGYVTPENFGGVRKFNAASYDEADDSTEAIQAALDSPYNLLIDGYYYWTEPLNITTPKAIKSIGYTSGETFAGRDESLGCLYTDQVVDCFRIFSGGVCFETPITIDVRGVEYNIGDANLAADYMPPVLFRYCYWANLIQYGAIRARVIGSQTNTRVFNGGHIGVFYDATSQFAADPVGKAALYGELHYIDIELEGDCLYTPVCGRLTEPYQDYSNSAIINHASIGGFRVASPTLDAATDPDTWTISTPSSSYTVANNAWRLMMFSWGLSSRFAIKVTSGGSSLISLINQAIVDAGYSTDTSLASTTPAFKAESRVGGGTNQAFTIRTNQDDLALTVVRPPLATVINYRVLSNGCKYAGQLETGDVCTGYFECQTQPVLAKSGTPVTLDAEISEWDFPCFETKGVNSKLNIYTIDLNKGSGVTYKANATAWVNYDNTNEMYGWSLESLYTREAKQYNNATSHEALIRNSPYFSHTRYGPGTGATGFIGALDNVLALANARWTVTTRAYVNSGFDFDTVGTADGESGATYSGTIATFANTASLFSDAVAMFQITYDSTFDETDDFIEIRITGMSGVDVQDVFVQFYTWNRARRVQVISLGDNENLLLPEINTLNNQNDWLEFQRFNPNASDEIVVRLIGVKDKSQTCQIAQIAGKDKYAAAVPRVCRDLRILDEGGTNYRRIIPQDATGITDYASLRAALIDAGIIY